MFSTLLSLSALLIGSSLAQYPPAYLYADGVYSPISGQIAAFHTGAGTNVAILTNDTAEALTGQFNNTYWTFNGFSSTYSLSMEPTADSDVFPDYGTVSITAGFATPGFSEGDEDSLLVWDNPDMANAGSWFAVCPSLIPSFEDAGVQDRVFWQSNEAAADEGAGGCTTIVLHGALE